MHYSSQHALFKDTLISALDLRNNTSCLHLINTKFNHATHFQQQLLINACMKWRLTS